MIGKIAAGVFGGSGYAGLDLVEILSAHPNVELIFATSNTYAGESVPGTDLQFVPSDDVELDQVDVIFPGSAAQSICRHGEERHGSPGESGGLVRRSAT